MSEERPKRAWIQHLIVDAILPPNTRAALPTDLLQPGALWEGKAFQQLPPRPPIPVP